MQHVILMQLTLYNFVLLCFIVALSWHLNNSLVRFFYFNSHINEYKPSKVNTSIYIGF